MLAHRSCLKKSLGPVVVCPYLCSSDSRERGSPNLGARGSNPRAWAQPEHACPEVQTSLGLGVGAFHLTPSRVGLSAERCTITYWRVMNMMWHGIPWYIIVYYNTILDYPTLYRTIMYYTIVSSECWGASCSSRWHPLFYLVNLVLNP